MANLLVAALAEANELTEALDKLLGEYRRAHYKQTIRAEVANVVYEICSNLHKLLCTQVLGDEAIASEMDAIYQIPALAAQYRKTIAETRVLLTRSLMNSYSIIKLESQALDSGRVSMASIILLCVAAFRRIEESLDPEAADRRTFTADFACARDHALIATQEQSEAAIEDLSVHALMNALHAIYAAAPSVPYSAQFEQYTGVVLRRALELLITPGPYEIFNMRRYRAELDQRHQVDSDKPLYRFSTLLLRDITLVWCALSEHFDLVHLLKRNDAPRSVCDPQNVHIAMARDWLLRNAATETQTWVRDSFVELSMRPGEMDFYHAANRGERSTVHLVLRDHRVCDYYRLMVDAIVPPALVCRRLLMTSEELARRGQYAQQESLHLSLVVLQTFMSRLKAAESNLDPSAFVLLPGDLRRWAPSLRQIDYPVLVVLHNHVQLWYNHELLMYNNALRAVTAWMLLVDKQCKRVVNQYSVGTLLDDFLRNDEIPGSRVARLAAAQERELPARGSGGVF